MLPRKSCYFFFRPKRKFLELCVFLGREIKAPQVRRIDRASKAKVVHTIRITSVPVFLSVNSDCLVAGAPGCSGNRVEQRTGAHAGGVVS